MRPPHVAQAITLPVTQRKYVGKVKIKDEMSQYVCYTETPVRVGEGKGAGFSDRLNPKTSVEGLLDNPCMCRRREA